MNIQWFPGHMTHALRAMKEDIKKTDFVIFIADARCVLSSLNPELLKLAGEKPKLFILNKADLAEEKITAEWIRYLEKEGNLALAVSAVNSNFRKQVLKKIDELMKPIEEKYQKKGYLHHRITGMVTGIPNVGKSTLLNLLFGSSSLKTGNKPGITKGNQWLHLPNNMDLLDTPGVLWPKFENEKTGLHLAFIGSVSDEIYDPAELGDELLRELSENHVQSLLKRYSIASSESGTVTLEDVVRARNIVKKGNLPDFEKAGRIVTDDFRNLKFGRISLEKAGE